MVKPKYLYFAWWSGLTILLSAFLLFQVQPVISKMILPWFGGTTAVWTTCMLFFQVLLVGGYSYAHLLSGCRSRRLQGLIHGSLILASLLTLPIIPDESFKPLDSSYPTVRILWLLTWSVGLPYFLLSATGPLVQAWYAVQYPGRSPYRLYALSNIGSLGALLTYPFLFEPALDLPSQGVLWSCVFGLFAACCLLLAALNGRSKVLVEKEQPGDKQETSSDDRPGRLDRWHWIWMPALASVMLLAVTQHICQQIVVMPFLWIAPLAIYLLSFIICFDREAWYHRIFFGWAGFLSVSWVAAVMLRYDVDAFLAKAGVGFNYAEFASQAMIQVTSYLVLLFVVCMLCHGEIVRRKPAVAYLTSFYLRVSVGGAIGGLLVSIACPLLFDSYLELPLALIVSMTFSLVIVVNQILPWGSGPQLAAALLVGAGIGLLGKAQLAEYQQNARSYDRSRKIQRDTRVARRNFYGVLRVVRQAQEENPRDDQVILMHGKTLHGIQFLADDRRQVPTAYYSVNSGVGLVMQKYLGKEPARVSVVGLGVGTLAAYGRPGDQFRFYEINPEVERLAREEFTFLEDSPAEVEVVVGDARLSLEQELSESSRHETDLLIVDAFSGDAVPVHLLTAEAVQLYLDHLKPKGVLAIHASTQHLRLIPVIARVARYHQVPFAVITTRPDADREVTEDMATWILLTRDQEVLADPEIREKQRIPSGEDAREVSLWTDKFSALYEIIY